MSKSFKKSKQLSSRPVASTRWNLEWSPLKISFHFGSPDAPAVIKDALAKEDAKNREDLAQQVKCVLLTWEQALAVLHRADVSLFHFHNEDYDWQINGWKYIEVGGTTAPLTHDELLALPGLPANPSRADIVAEVMMQYCHGIDSMEQTVPLLYKALTFNLEVWLQPALQGLLPVTKGLYEMKMDARAMCRRAYEIAETGHSDINPISESVELTEEQGARLNEALGAKALVQ